MNAVVEETKEKKPQGPSKADLAKRWTEEFAVADKKIKPYMDKGEKIVDKFRDKRSDEGESVGFVQRKLNLFNSNIVTLMAMLYGNTPKVELDRTFGDAKDDAARVASMMATRMLQQDIQDAGEDYKTVLRSSLQDRLLPGMGSARVRYDFEEETIQHPAVMSEDGMTELAAAYPETKIKSEWVEKIYTHWKDLKWSPARTYSELRWKAYRSYMTKEQAKKRFDEEIVKKMNFSSKGAGDTGKGNDGKGEAITQAEVWEIWSKTDRQVFWYSQGVDEILDVVDDPLQLDGFWPDPPPMVANLTTTEFMPTSDYVLAQDLYEEIDKLQTRISILTEAAKVVGVYDGANEELKRVFQEGCENDLIAVTKWAAFAEKGGLKGSLDWIPLEAVVSAIDVLTGKLNEKIQQLYQVTGMSDIMRGASQPYEAASTSKAKVQFASIRVQALQDEFARFASDLESLALEIIQKHFQPYCIIQQSNIEATDSAMYAEEAVKLLKDRNQARWRIRIRPESMAMADYAQLKADRTEYLTAVATFLQSSAALAQLDKDIVPVLLKMLQWGLAGFKGSQDVETVLDEAIKLYTDKAANPPPEKPDPKLEQIKMEMQLSQQEAQAKMQQEQMKAQMQQQQMQQQFQLEMAKMQQEMRQDQQKHQLEMQKMIMELKQEREMAQIKQQTTMVEQAAQAAFNNAERDNELSFNQQNRQGDMEAKDHAHKIQMESADAKARANKSNGGNE